jgi:para-aminobenzoate synthetase/4-amino-4-deoxychorismate lyase
MQFVVATRTPSVTAVIQDNDGWLCFERPAMVIRADHAFDVRAAVAEVERLTRDRGLHAVGCLSYEAGEAFGLAVRRADGRFPLAWFALFHPADVTEVPAPAGDSDYRLGVLEPGLSFADFCSAFQAIRAALAAGDTYQANLTFPMRASFEGSAPDLFADLVAAQRGAYSVYLSLDDDVAVCSASPELFFEIEGSNVRARPMKGTVIRGRTAAEDASQRAALCDSAKQQAENVMIVDMMRNDLGRIAEIGSVRVPSLFTAERYPNVWQLTSSVEARTRASLEEIVAALHPSASVTGAPKVRTMQLLASLEASPRGLYTGTIGHVRPDGNARFNVAIRTAVVDRREGTVTFGIGSGIVWDSEARIEYDECLAKGSVLGQRPRAFSLLETLRWTPESGFFLLDRHIARLCESAAYFDFNLSPDAARDALARALAAETSPRRVRLLVDADGGVRVELAPHTAASTILSVALAPTPIDDRDRYLFHKTTNRGVYERTRAQVPQHDEVVLWNERSEVTEASTANIVVEVDGQRVTPPVSCGLLAGTFRAELLARGEIRERIVSTRDLQSATAIWLINSVHEWRQARLDPMSGPR